MNLTLREQELYTGDCPSERPCTPEMVAAYRAYFDALEVGPLSLIQKAINLGQAVIQHVAAGMPTVTDEQHAARMAVCQGTPGLAPKCDHLQGTSCNLCSCYITLKAKMAMQKCPAGKWPELPVVQP